jgi:hypothetical protein
VKFFLDHDVPTEVGRVLRQEGHEVIELRQVLPVQPTCRMRTLVSPAQPRRRIWIAWKHQMAEQDCDNRQGGTAKNSRTTYIKKIPKENTNLETTTTDPDLLNKRSDHQEATQQSSSPRVFLGVELSGSSSYRTGCPNAGNASTLVDQLVIEFGLNGKQRKDVDKHLETMGEEYVRIKAEIVRAQPRRNVAGALLAALRDDWQPPIQTNREAAGKQARLGASQALARKMGWEW